MTPTPFALVLVSALLAPLAPAAVTQDPAQASLQERAQDPRAAYAAAKQRREAARERVRRNPGDARARQELAAAQAEVVSRGNALRERARTGDVARGDDKRGDDKPDDDRREILLAELEYDRKPPALERRFDEKRQRIQRKFDEKLRRFSDRGGEPVPADRRRTAGGPATVAAEPRLPSSARRVSARRSPGSRPTGQLGPPTWTVRAAFDADGRRFGLPIGA